MSKISDQRKPNRYLSTVAIIHIAGNQHIRYMGNLETESQFRERLSREYFMGPDDQHDIRIYVPTSSTQEFYNG